MFLTAKTITLDGKKFLIRHVISADDQKVLCAMTNLFDGTDFGEVFIPLEKYRSLTEKRFSLSA